MQYVVYAVDENGCPFEQIFNQPPSNAFVTELKRDGYKDICVETRYSNLDEMYEGVEELASDCTSMAAHISHYISDKSSNAKNVFEAIKEITRTQIASRSRFNRQTWLDNCGQFSAEQLYLIGARFDIWACVSRQKEYAPK